MIYFSDENVVKRYVCALLVYKPNYFSFSRHVLTYLSENFVVLRWDKFQCGDKRAFVGKCVHLQVNVDIFVRVWELYIFFKMQQIW